MECSKVVEKRGEYHHLQLIYCILEKTHEYQVQYNIYIKII